MVSLLAKKMLREIKMNIVQFLAILAMAFITLFVIAGLGTQSETTLDNYLEATNFRDLELSELIFTYDDIDAINTIPEVVSTEGYLTTIGKTGQDKERDFILSYITGDSVSNCYVVEGEKFDPNKDGIWMDASFAGTYDISVGDVFHYTLNNMHCSEVVRGLIYNPQFLYYMPNNTFIVPDYEQYGFGILSISEYPGTKKYFTRLIVDVDGVPGGRKTNKSIKNELALATNEIEKIIDNDNLVIKNKEEDDQIKAYLEYTESSRSLRVIFSPIFACIALLGIMTTMTRLIAKQRTTIGALKALGITSRTIHIHYICYSVFIIAVGCILGTIVGYNTLGNMMYYDLELYFQNPFERKVLTEYVWIGSIALILASILVTYLCNRKLLSSATARILQPLAPKSASRGAYERWSWWKRLKFVTRWNIRDIANNKLRTLISLIGILLCSMLIFAASSFYNILTTQAELRYEHLLTLEYTVNFADGTSLETAKEYADEYAGQLVEVVPITITVGDVTKKYSLSILDEGNCHHMIDEDGNYIHFAENGVMATMRMQRETGLKVGSKVSFVIDGEDETYTDIVGGLCLLTSHQGIAMTREHWEEMNGEFKPTEMYTRKTVPKYIEERDEIDSVKSRAESQKALNDLVAANTSKVFMIIFVAIFIGAVVLYNLGSLAYSEKVKDLATLKVLGFSSKNLKKIIMQQNMGLTIIGAILGIPPGFKCIELLVSMMGVDTDSVINVPLYPYLIAIILTIALSYGINSYIVKDIENVNMAQALKGG